VNWADIKASVKELGDGRDFTAAEYVRWVNRVRSEVSMDFEVAGFNGLYFLYKEGTVLGGSVALQGKYAIPDDFIDDLNVFYDGNLLAKASRGQMDISQQEGVTATTPAWVRMAGVEFELIPAPPDAGKEIKLLYNGLVDDLTTTTGDSFEDFFMKHFPEIHVYGMAKFMAPRLGKFGQGLLPSYLNQYNTARRQLALHNRRHWVKNVHIRFQNADEFELVKYILFPNWLER
jgi:hypothetical protein